MSRKPIWEPKKNKKVSDDVGYKDFEKGYREVLVRTKTQTPKRIIPRRSVEEDNRILASSGDWTTLTHTQKKYRNSKNYKEREAYRALLEKYGESHSKKHKSFGALPKGDTI